MPVLRGAFLVLRVFNPRNLQILPSADGARHAAGISQGCPPVPAGSWRSRSRGSERRWQWPTPRSLRDPPCDQRQRRHRPQRLDRLPDRLEQPERFLVTHFDFPPLLPPLALLNDPARLVRPRLPLRVLPHAGPRRALANVSIPAAIRRRPLLACAGVARHARRRNPLTSRSSGPQVATAPINSRTTVGVSSDRGTVPMTFISQPSGGWWF